MGFGDDPLSQRFVRLRVPGLDAALYKQLCYLNTNEITSELHDEVWCLGLIVNDVALETSSPEELLENESLALPLEAQRAHVHDAQRWSSPAGGSGRSPL
jgi:hypothetical protein